MKKRKFLFLKCCDWLYQGALSAGILFVLQGFFGNDLAEIEVFPTDGAFSSIIAAGVFTAQLLFVWSGSGEKKYRLRTALLFLIALNVTVGMFMKTPESRTVFWCYVGLEAVCIVAASAVYIIRRYPVPTGILIIAQTGALVALAILKKPLSGWCVCIMFAAFLIYIVELTAKNTEKILGLLPMFAAAMLILCFIPRNDKPMDWSWINGAYTAVEEKAKMLVVDIAYMFEGEDDFTFSFSGYGDKSGLGGVIFDSIQPQIHITGNGTKNPLYLTGGTYGVYTGEGWENAEQKIENPNVQTERDGMLKALNDSVYADYQGGLTASCLTAVEYRFIKTADFFHDLHTTNLYFYGETPKFSDKAPWKMKKPYGKDFNYRFRFLEYNENSEEIKAILRQKAWKKDVVWDEASQHREAEIYETYTQLPDNIPPRVYELAHTLAADADNDYDRMKAFAEYLSSYTYTKSPPDCPDGREFTDYFLFDSKSGYCTCFATAMAVLGRCEGIPTRYAKGFMTADTMRSQRADVMLTGDNAHAWTEAYIAHVGWVRFDATPGYGNTSTVEKWQAAETWEIEQTENPYEGIGLPQDKPEDKPEHEGKPAQWYAVNILKITAALLAGYILAAVIFVLLRNALRRRKYSQMETLGKMRSRMKHLLRLGRLRGMPLSEEETLQAYQERTDGLLDTEGFSFGEACSLYEGVRFGEKTASTEDLHSLESYAGKVEHSYLAECGFIKQIIYYII